MTDKPRTAKKKPARKSLPTLKVRARLTQDLADKVASFIRTGNYAKVAAVLAGCSESGFYNWMKRGRELLDGEDKPTSQKDRLCMYLVESVNEAECYAEGVHVQRILKAGEHTWQASAWFLERKHYDRWGRKERIEHASPDGSGPMTGVLIVGSGKETAEEWEELAVKQQDLLRGA